jgi:serine/threonine-protein kinase
MQIDLWASKKTLAELRAKIEQLNSIYRMKVDTLCLRYDMRKFVMNLQDIPPPPVTPRKKLLNLKHQNRCF